MSQYLAVIGLSTLDGTNGFELDGVLGGDNSGYSVSFAGDLNGDGFDDLIIGAPKADTTDTLSGASYVVFGKAGGFGAAFDLSSLDGNNGFRVDGDFGYDQSGRSVSRAGDVNGDGFDDVIIGAPDSSANGGYSGAAYVVFGKASGWGATLSLNTLDGNDGFQISGEDLAYNSGTSVDAAGDVNGDGIGDVLVGAFGANPNGGASGAAYVVFGTNAGFSAEIDLADLDGNNGFKINGEVAGDLAGWSVSAIGDGNGDGIGDILIGAKGADPHGNNSGAAYVLFGTDAGFAAEIELDDLDGTNGLQLSGITDNDQTGIAVSGAGDFNADGFADLLIGADGAAPNGGNSGAAYVVFGLASGFGPNVNLSGLGNHGFRINGESSGYGTGYSVSSAGDFNGDGFDDVIIGAWHADPNGGNSGAAYVVFGTAAGNFGGALELSALDGNNGFKIEGEAGGDAAGLSVSGAGDLNGDGFADLIVGAAYADPNLVYGSGASYVIYGGKPAEAVTRAGTSIANTIQGGDLADRLKGGGGDDTLIGHDDGDALKGNKGNDTLVGGAGADILNGGGGDDTYVFDSVSDSTGLGYDTARRVDFGAETFDVGGTIAAIDATVATGTLRTAHFDDDLAAVVGAGQLGAGNAVIYTPDGGNLAGETFLIVDQNGTAGYQAGEDLVINLLSPVNAGSLGTEDFI